MTENFAEQFAAPGTPYLGKEGFDCIRASIDEAKKQSLTPYL